MDPGLIQHVGDVACDLCQFLAGLVIAGIVVIYFGTIFGVRG